ncbi:hypothetical protein Tco_1257488 [Tanacetum coccineum]
MKRPTKGFLGQEVALFPTMLDVTEPSTSPSRITSSPSYSPEHSPLPKHSPSPTHSPSPAPSPTPEHITAAPTQPSPTQPSPGAEHHLPTPNESPIHAVHSHRSDEGSLKLNELIDLVTKLFDRIRVLEDDLKTTKQTYNTAFTKLILRVKKLEAQVKIGKVMRRARIVQSDDEDIADDSSKQGRILSDAEVQEKASNETEPVIQDVTPTEVQIYQTSQENSQKRANTDTGNGRAQEKPKIQNQSQKKSSFSQMVNPQSTSVNYRVKSRGFLQLRVKMENSSDQEQDGKDKSVKSSSLIGSLMPHGLKEAQKMMIFALDHSHNKHKGHIKH